MALLSVSSPHQRSGQQTPKLMRQVIYATLPALLALSVCFGLGYLLNSLWCMLLAIVFEAVCLKLRGKAVLFFLKDGSAAVTGLLLGLSLSPLAPWWLPVIGLFFAIVIAKHLYGGLGQNPFNPAMVAYALLLVSFPVEMTRWPQQLIDLSSWWSFFTGNPLQIDQLTGATVLDTLRQQSQYQGITQPSFLADGHLSASSALVNLSFGLGGLYLLRQKVIQYAIPVSMLASLSLMSLLFYCVDSQHFASPILHLLSGATMMAAFFIATDPVSAATTPLGRLIYGAGIGLLIYIVRTWGGYPDAVAFAVLLMNLAAPMLDHLCQPRTFGHQPIKWTKKQP
ncbi:RnfABCDGE type electron transport complex subunit D [Agitococcus lubricus]|uniref:Ion-translocating oxidoreductase complex subunit D n=1 Tax=Agitococcus lubricus TaxID=1077255 RepID=A0A2T5IVG3_9GAMM|nr:RnfABCDGE type electron transport complex subunit D [Agitococcus lubricus]PTQ87868.1 electron transport complex protein RnfD [Agitococcus lubricus]